MKTKLVGLAVALAVIGLVYFMATSIRAVAQRGTEITEGVVTRYVGLLQEEKYGEAWDCCLAASYQQHTPREAFAAAHAARRRSFGALERWTATDYQHEADLLSDESLIGINAVLHYAERDVFVLYKVDSVVEPLRIQATLGSAGTSTMLSSGSW